MSNLYAFAYECLSDVDCSECGQTPERGRPKLSFSDKNGVDLESNYTCSGCSTQYQIEAVDKEESVEITIIRADTGNERKIHSSKVGLQVDTHTAREPLDDLAHLRSALGMLEFNKESFIHLTEHTPEYAKDDDFPGGTLQHPVLRHHMLSAIHNYLTAAYTFEQVFRTLRGRLPTGESVESQFQEYHQNSRVIIGLRTYIQHEQIIPYSITPDMDADGYKIHFQVDLDDVWTLDSQMSPDNPHGYDTPPEELYQDVDGDNIDLEQHINQHFRQALRLVEVTESYVHDTLEEEIEDFYDVAEPLMLSDMEAATPEE